MEFPGLGQQCHETSCKRLDFLPVKCDACANIFCSDHMSYAQHSCPSAYKKDIQVPVCPLCNTPVPTPRNQLPDVTVNEHIDRDCQSDPAKAKRKVNSNKCSLAGCRNKEMIPVVCSECRKNFCLRHRFPDDHKCAGKTSQSLQAALNRQNRPAPSNTSNAVTSVQGNMSEDEALARALAESMRDMPQGVPSGGPTRHRVPTTVGPQRCDLS